MCDYRRGLDWWSDLTHNTWLHFTDHTHTHTLLSSVTVFTALLGNGFENWKSLYSGAHILAGWRASHTVSEYLVSQNLCYDRRSVGQSVMISSPHFGSKITFLLPSDSRGFVDWRALSDENPSPSFISRNGSWSSLYSLGTDYTENISSIIACLSAEPLSSKGRVCRAVP
jgi:hypothetical protein